MSFCGTDQACQECPLSKVAPGEYGTFDLRFEKAEKMGAAAEQLARRYRAITNDMAATTLIVLGIGVSEEDVEKLQTAIDRQATGECTVIENLD